MSTACDDRAQPTPGNGGGGGSVDRDDDDNDRESCTLDKVRGLAESCCESYGIDACGAGLFCAAFDGRTASTCYPNNVRRAGETCALDIHCTSSTCAPNGQCAALLTDTCDAETGCATVSGTRYVCVQEQCQPVGGDYCFEDSDCENRTIEQWVCRGSRCVSSASAKYAGESCTVEAYPSECLSNNCFQGSCGCNKETHNGCPAGTTCTGGGHVVWGTRCE